MIVSNLDNANVGFILFDLIKLKGGNKMDYKDDKLNDIVVSLRRVKEKAPLVHNITNYVTVNDCANIILACGGSPIMADDLNEVEDITSICNSLVINIGTLNESTILSMIKAGKKSNELNHPVILDPVGIGASKFRMYTVSKLLEEVHFSVIRGNASEIKVIYKGDDTTTDIDINSDKQSTSYNTNELIGMAKQLSQRTGAIIVITGEIDIITNGEKVYKIKNGNPMMGKIKGTGCMLSAMMGAFCGASKSSKQLEAVTTSVSMMGLAGEYAYAKVLENQRGMSSFRMHVIESISKMDEPMLLTGAKIECY